MCTRTKKDLVASIYTETEWKVNNMGVSSTEEEETEDKEEVPSDNGLGETL